MAESSGIAQDEPGSLAFDEVLQQMVQDDQEEWEYEYSTTETETYYLPLELSYPEFKGTSAKMNIHSRGGYYKNWQDTHVGGNAAATRPPVGAAGEGSRGSAQIKDEDSSNDEAQPKDDGGAMIDPSLRAKGKAPARAAIDLTRASTREATTEPAAPGNDPLQNEWPELRNEIQIIELHSDHPLISYRGRLFEGEWAEIIGTEALFVRHDTNGDALPALRRVPGDIDLLGAVSSRIVTREKTATARAKDQADPLAAARAEFHIAVPPGKDRTGARQQQARFLENLMAVKKMKGQTDDVTVYALDGDGKDFDDTKAPDYKPRRKRVTVGDTAGGRRGRLAAARRGKQRAVREPVRSTPTPARWGDLDEEGEEEEEEAGEAMDEDEDYDVSMG
ncbi:Transcription factor tau55-related [Cordyceps militaris]|uniref:Transcription factor tau55-related n=1 Tax=Cordyceps militaris TaxID=73501 RepID=A0A2H4STH1_CORMI|nr:Transcription factor tau55-related [Cordyceps militaris]